MSTPRRERKVVTVVLCDLVRRLFTASSFPYASLNADAGGDIVIGSVARYLGLLATTMGHSNEAAQHFEDALAMNERMGARPWLAHTQRDYTRTLLARDELATANAPRSFSTRRSRPTAKSASSHPQRGPAGQRQRSRQRRLVGG